MKKIGVIVFLIGYHFVDKEDPYGIRNPPVSIPRIVCFGDSLPHGAGASKQMG